ncbi:hypothetical protein [Nocardia asteroides]
MNRLVAMPALHTATADPETHDQQVNSDRAKLADLLLVVGRRAGKFRDFDPGLMAEFVLSLRNGVVGRATAEPALDLATCTRELLTAIELATGFPRGCRCLPFTRYSRPGGLRQDPGDAAQSLLDVPTGDLWETVCER